MRKLVLIIMVSSCILPPALRAQTTPAKVTILSDRLTDPDPEIRQTAAKRLSALGKDAEPAVPKLILCVSDKDPGVRRAAILALDNIGASSASTIRALDKALEDPSNLVRFDAASALEDLGSAASDSGPALLRCLQSDNDSLLTSCGSAAKKIGISAKDATPVALRLLRGGSYGQTVAALDLLSGVNDAGALPDGERSSLFNAVVERVNDKTYDVQLRALNALGTLGLPDSASKADFERIIRASNSQDENIREASIASLAQIQNDEAEATLLKLLSDPSSDVRLAAVKSFNIAKDPTTIPALISSLGDQSVAVRLAAISALNGAELGKDEICTSLRDRASDRAVDVRVATTNAMSKCDESIVLTALLTATSDREVPVRAEALSSLAAVSPHKGWQSRSQRTDDDTKTIQTELAALDDPEDDVRSAAAKGLASLMPIPDSFKAKVGSELTNSNSDAREVSARVIGTFGPSASEFSPSVVALLKDPVQNVRIAAIWSIGLMGVRDRETAMALADVLKNSDNLEDGEAGLQRAVLLSLARFGSAALPALNTVVETILNSSDSDVKEAGIRALRDMGPQAGEALKAAYEKAPVPIPPEVLAQQSVGELMGNLGRVDKNTVTTVQHSYADMLKTASVRVMTPQGKEVSLTAGGHEVLIVVGSWCPHSRRLVSFLANPTIRQLTKDWNFHFVFVDETPVIRKVGSLADSSQPTDTKTPTLYDVSFLKDLPGDYFFYSPEEKDSKMGFPEGYDVLANKFSVGGEEIVKLELAMPDWILRDIRW